MTRADVVALRDSLAGGAGGMTSHASGRLAGLNDALALLGPDAAPAPTAGHLRDLDGRHQASAAHQEPHRGADARGEQGIARPEMALALSAPFPAEPDPAPTLADGEHPGVIVRRMMDGAPGESIGLTYQRIGERLMQLGAEKERANVDDALLRVAAEMASASADAVRAVPTYGETGDALRDRMAAAAGNVNVHAIVARVRK